MGKFLLLWLVGALSAHAGEKVKMVSSTSFCPLAVTLNVLDVQPRRPAKGLLIHLTGFGDSSANYTKYAKYWAIQGYRVVIYDYPSHGETTGTTLNRYGVNDLARMTAELISLKSSGLPIFITAWSTGGTIAAQMLKERMLGELHELVTAAVFLAPGIPVRLLVGDWGWVTPPTLTHNPDPESVGSISPTTPFAVPFFAWDLYWTSRALERGGLLSNVPLFVFTGDEKEDRYVHTDAILRWAQNQRHLDGKVYSYSFAGARHALLAESCVQRNCILDVSRRFFSSARQGTLEREFYKPRQLTTIP